MTGAFVFLNCDLGAELTVINQLNEIDGISEAVRVSGIYDIVAKLNEQSKEDIVSLVRKIRGITNIRSSLTMVIAKSFQ